MKSLIQFRKISAMWIITGLLIFVSIALTPQSRKQEKKAPFFEQLKADLKKKNTELKKSVDQQDTAIIEKLEAAEDQTVKKPKVKYRIKKVHDTVLVVPAAELGAANYIDPKDYFSDSELKEPETPCPPADTVTHIIYNPTFWQKLFGKKKLDIFVIN